MPATRGIENVCYAFLAWNPQSCSGYRGRVMEKTIAETNRAIAHALSTNLARLLMEVGGDFDRCVLARLHQAGYPDIRPAHQTVFANLGTGAVRVSELAERAQVTQQAMGKTL